MPSQSIGLIREFRTKHFRVIVDAVEEYDLDISYDETSETRDNLESGKWIAFCARARVIHDELGELSSDYLGNCIYDSLERFAQHGGYFDDMVSTVCADARKRWQELTNMVAATKLRAVQS